MLDSVPVAQRTLDQSAVNETSTNNAEIYAWRNVSVPSFSYRRIEEEPEAVQQRWREWTNALRSADFSSSLISEATANSIIALSENVPAL